jgi:hypothetical protein
VSDTATDRWLGAWRGRPEVQEAAAQEVARLGWLYVSRLAEERRPDDLVDLLARLRQRDISYLRALRFLASPEAVALLETGSSLLRRLPQSTRQARGVAREVRGRVDWAATVQERLSRGGDTTVFVVSRADRHADVPVNRVLAYVLCRMSEAGQALAGHPETAARGLEAERLLSNAALASVRVPTQLSGMDRQSLRMSRLPEFREQVAEALALHDSLFADDLDGLRASLGDRVWLPPEADKLFELWVLFAIVRSLEKEGWQVAALRLIGGPGGSAPTFVLRKDSKEVRIAYQAIPADLLRTSRYKRILDTYDIDGSARRPDILLSAPGPGRALHLLVEAKLTDDRDYIVESIYKVLGYLADFEESLAESPVPRSVLVVWGGVGSSGPPGPDHPMLVLDHDAVRAGGIVPLVEVLSSAAQLPPGPAA